MRLDDERESSNVEDRRDEGDYGGGGGGGFNFGGGSIGIGGIVLALVASYFLGINPLTLLSMFSGGGAPVQVQQPQRPAHAPPKGDPSAHLVSVILANTEDTWTDIFAKMGRHYVDPKLVLFRRRTPTACGTGVTAQGPFYCPGDQKVYIDLEFFDELKNRFHSPGEFAQAYVVAHEVGHHVQNLLGITAKVEDARRRSAERGASGLSVRLELQADCFAGVWANRANQTRHILETGDIEAGLQAASQIGDDTLQRNAGQAVSPDSFTHGTSAQRVAWFKRGIDAGDIKNCDTFKARQL
jgi:predicted metalloprotease